MITTSPQVRPPQIPEGFHAFMLADIYVHDPGKGSYLDVVFTDGTTLRARASSEVLRQSQHLNGSLRATLHFRTDDKGRLREPLHLYRVRQIERLLDHPSGTSWSVAGIVSTRQDALMVYPEKARAQPFRIHFRLEAEEGLEGRAWQSVRAGGVIRDSHLVATRLQLVQPMIITSRWLNWRQWL